MLAFRATPLFRFPHELTDRRLLYLEDQAHPRAISPGLRKEVRKHGLTSWDTLTIPFKKFSSDWSDYTGECATRDPDGYQHQCCETGTEHICPSEEGLSHINGLSVWAEGVEGDFKLEVLSISAVALGPTR